MRHLGIKEGRWLCWLILDSGLLGLSHLEKHLSSRHVLDFVPRSCVGRNRPRTGRGTRRVSKGVHHLGGRRQVRYCTKGTVAGEGWYWCCRVSVSNPRLRKHRKLTKSPCHSQIRNDKPEQQWYLKDGTGVRIQLAETNLCLDAGAKSACRESLSTRERAKLISRNR